MNISHHSPTQTAGGVTPATWQNTAGVVGEVEIVAIEDVQYPHKAWKEEPQACIIHNGRLKLVPLRCLSSDYPLPG